MPPRATWRFPDSNYGLFQDYNDNQTAHFARDPINHLVRECIQNSLDARDADTVTVHFDEVSIPTAILDAENYREHLLSCADESSQRRCPAAEADYRQAADQLSEKDITTLLIRDAGTTGLAGENWAALTSSQGTVRKTPAARPPGGSFGVGKNTAFRFSSIHAVIYSTRYANRREGRIEKALGRAQLMSHPKRDSDDYHQASGWLDTHQKPWQGRDIPTPLRLPESGAGIFILGWNPPGSDWPEQIALRAAQNFFAAIHQRQLQVNVGSGSTPRRQIDHASIEEILTQPDDKNARRFLSHYRAICQSPEPELVHARGTRFKLHLNTDTGTNRAALVTGNGMFVTDATSLAYNPLHVQHQSTWPDHTVVAIPKDATTELWVRRMENPSHDSISPEQLSTLAERRQAQQIFQSIRRQIRAAIDAKVGGAQPASTVNVVELADLLPEEPAPAGADAFKPPLVKPARPASVAPTAAEITAGGPDQTPEQPGDSKPTEPPTNPPGKTAPPASGDNPNTDGSSPQETPAQPAAILSHRIIAADARRAHLFLTAKTASRTRIAVQPAGAEFRREPELRIAAAQVIAPPDLKLTAEFPADSFLITPPPNDRIHLELTFTDRINHLALKLA